MSDLVLFLTCDLCLTCDRSLVFDWVKKMKVGDKLTEIRPNFVKFTGRFNKSHTTAKAGVKSVVDH